MAENYRLLVIDDMESIHQDFRKILQPKNPPSSPQFEEMHAKILGTDSKKQELPPYEIDSAYQGEEGFSMVKKSLSENRPYALVFVDVLMPPGEDGIETIRHIWELDANVQIVICTAYAKYSWEEIAKRFGTSDRLFVLKKPFDNLEVLQLASTLSRKWNLNQEMNEQLSMIKKDPEHHLPEVEKSINKLKETVQSLSKINRMLKKK